MRRSTTTPAALLLPALLLLTTPAWGKKSDESLKIDQGLWEVTTTFTYASVDEPTVETRIMCLQPDYFTPERVVGEMTKSCKIKKSRASEREMSWKVTCKDKTGSNFSGSGTIKSTGSKASGKTTTTMKLGGESLVSETTWEGKRLGVCETERTTRSPKPRMQAPTESGQKTKSIPPPAEPQGN